MNPAASLGAVLELLRALNWMIRADVPWPTKRGQTFDFVLVGEPGVFALCVHDGEPDGVVEAAAGLSALLDGVRVRAVVCRDAASLRHAHRDVLYCTPETALDLLIGLPPDENPAAIRAIAAHLRDLEIPMPPEQTPVVVVEPPKVAPPKVEAPKVAPPKVEAPKVAPKVEAPKAEAPKVEAPKVEAPKEARDPALQAAKPASTPAPTVTERPPQTAVVPAPAAPVGPTPRVGAKQEPPFAPMPKPETPPPSKAAPVEEVRVAAPAPEPSPRLPAGRHRSERPRRARRPAPPPPADVAPPGPMLPKSTLELPTAMVLPQSRVRGGSDAAQRFDNNYVFVPEPVDEPGALKREFRAKPFLMGIVVLVVVVLAAGVGVRVWPQLAGLVGSSASPSAAFGQTITASSTDFHPSLRLSVTSPQLVATSHGTVSYAVDFSASNVGSTSWVLPPRTAFVLVDALGESHALASISDVASSRWGGSLRPAQSRVGRLIFMLRSGRTPLRLRLALASDGSETATWHN